MLPLQNVQKRMAPCICTAQRGHHALKQLNTHLHDITYAQLVRCTPYCTGAQHILAAILQLQDVGARPRVCACTQEPSIGTQASAIPCYVF